ncbi:MAG TPA: preprotein translocase subunit SecG [Deinococcales bacterium]|nr:preprotein translocase subunit SecG [Deinococcales bacterium]
MLYILFLALMAVGVFLVWFVLLQEPKQGGLSGSMGGSSEFLGGHGVSGGLVRLTMILGILYILLAIVLNLIHP